VYCRAESKDKKQSENNEIASLNTMIGLVARVFRPGCKIDTYPVLISKGGMKKTTFCETLAGSSNLVKSMSGDLSKPDFLNQMNRAWIVEFAEMKSISSAKEEEIKSFMTRTEDTYRVAYGRTDYERKRHVFFIGTSNQDEFLFDQASARRFYPVFVQTEIDIQKLKEDRDQLLAEAVYRYKNNQPWWIYPDIEYQQQLMAQEDGEEEILETLESIETNGSGIRISTIRNSLGVRALKFTDNKISRILKKNGWQRIRHNGFNEWYRDAQ
jgi:predicted P-loop ATPase